MPFDQHTNNSDILKKNTKKINGVTKLDNVFVYFKLIFLRLSDATTTTEDC